MFSILSSLFGGKSKSRPAPVRNARPQVEMLEGRLVPANFVPRVDAGGNLVILGMNQNDQVRVEFYNGQYRVFGFTDGAAWGGRKYFNASEVSAKRVIFHGFGGDDRFVNATSTLRVEAHGGEGHDTLTGGKLNDVLDGGPGHDILNGKKGNDEIAGGDGNDTLLGEIGNDTLHGDAGFDVLKGGDGNDYLYGDGDNDILWGELGNDRMYGGDGDDKLYASDGHDILYGGIGNDILVGDWGNDQLYGEQGYDKLYGGGNDDYLSGGIDGIADYLSGGIGKDRFKGEWVQDSSALFLSYKNLDKPVDLNTTQGDSVDSPFVLVRI